MSEWRIQTAVSVVLLAGLSASALADSARGLVRRGNRAYAEGRYDEALAAYEQADVESPESPVIAFNQGTVQYRAEDFGAARESFEKAARGKLDPGFEARCRYNLGNCWFREVRRQMDSDLGKAVEACERSVDEYQAAVALDPELEAARRNIEVVRRLWKSILDEQKRRQEEQQAQQEQAQHLAEQLKQLIERQEQAAGQSAELARQQASEGTTPALQQQSAAQADNQRQLGQDTQAAADTLQQMTGQTQPAQAPAGGGAQTTAPQHPALGHMDEARQAQEQAVQKLGQTEPGAATDDQTKAAEALRKALESMSQNQDGQQQQQQQQGDQEQQQGEQEQGEQEQEQEQKQEQGQEQAEQQQQQAAKEGDEDGEESKDQEQTRARLADQDARDILDTEKRNRERRTAAEQRGLAPVDKDW